MRSLHNDMYLKIIDLVTAHGPCSLTGSDIKGNTVVPESELSKSYEDQSSYFFEKYSKDLLVEVKEPFWKVDPNQSIADHDSSMDRFVGPQRRCWALAGYAVGKILWLSVSCPVTSFLCVPEYLELEKPIRLYCA